MKSARGDAVFTALVVWLHVPACVVVASAVVPDGRAAPVERGIAFLSLVCIPQVTEEQQHNRLGTHHPWCGLLALLCAATPVLVSSISPSATVASTLIFLALVEELVFRVVLPGRLAACFLVTSAVKTAFVVIAAQLAFAGCHFLPTLLQGVVRWSDAEAVMLFLAGVCGWILVDVVGVWLATLIHALVNFELLRQPADVGARSLAEMAVAAVVVFSALWYRAHQAPRRSPGRSSFSNRIEVSSHDTHTCRTCSRHCSPVAVDAGGMQGRAGHRQAGSQRGIS